MNEGRSKTCIFQLEVSFGFTLLGMLLTDDQCNSSSVWLLGIVMQERWANSNYRDAGKGYGCCQSVVVNGTRDLSIQGSTNVYCLSLQYLGSQY